MIHTQTLEHNMVTHVRHHAATSKLAEDLSDRQAALAVRCRIDWKYCLGLPLEDPGFDYSVLSEFRDRMAEGDRADRLLAAMVERLVDAGLIKSHGRVPGVPQIEG